MGNVFQLFPKKKSEGEMTVKEELQAAKKAYSAALEAADDAHYAWHELESKCDEASRILCAAYEEAYPD